MASDLSRDALDSALTGRFGRPFTYLQETDSTNERALEMLVGGATEGTLVVADHQTSGRGRRGRTWESPPATGLLFSLVLRPASHEALELLTTALGVAVATGVREALRVEARLKWPNDVVVEDRKLAGILVESRLAAHGIEGSVAGVGLNVTWPADENHAANLDATSIALLTNKEVSRAALLQRILVEFESAYSLLTDERGRVQVVERAADLSSVLDRQVSVRFGDGSKLEGKAVGLSETGALQVEREGQVENVSVGEIEQLRAF